MDGSAALGCLTVLRHTVLQESFPDFLSYGDDNPESYCKRYMIRGQQNAYKKVDADTLRRHWDIVNHSVDIVVQKITHQNRVEVGKIMLNKGCFAETAERTLGHCLPGQKKMNEATRTFYTQLPPAEGLSAVGGGDPANPQAYVVCH